MLRVAGVGPWGWLYQRAACTKKGRDAVRHHPQGHGPDPHLDRAFILQHFLHRRILAVMSELIQLSALPRALGANHPALRLEESPAYPVQHALADFDADRIRNYAFTVTIPTGPPIVAVENHTWRQPSPRSSDPGAAADQHRSQRTATALGLYTDTYSSHLPELEHQSHLPQSAYRPWPSLFSCSPPVARSEAIGFQYGFTASPFDRTSESRDCRGPLEAPKPCRTQGKQTLALEDAVCMSTPRCRSMRRDQLGSPDSRNHAVN
jgi:hypothetical protein